MAPARDGAGADAAPVVGRAPAVDAREGDRALSFRALLAGSLILLTVFFYEDAMELRMHARRMMFGNRAHEAVLIPGWMRSEAPGVETLAEHEREAATAWGEVEAFVVGEEARASRTLGPRGERAPATPAAPRVDRDETATGSAGRAAEKPTLAPEPPPADVDAMWGTVDDDPYVDDDAPPPKATKTKTTPPPPPPTTTTTTKSDASASASSDTVPKVSLASLAAEAAVNSAADKAKAKAARDAKAAAAAEAKAAKAAKAEEALKARTSAVVEALRDNRDGLALSRIAEKVAGTEAFKTCFGLCSLCNAVRPILELPLFKQTCPELGYYGREQLAKYALTAEDAIL